MTSMNQSAPPNARANLQGFEMDRALERLAGNSQLYNTLLENFMNRYSVCSMDARKLFEEGRLEEVQRLAHTFKGLGGTIGHPDLAETSAALEKAAAGAIANGPAGPADDVLENALADFCNTIDEVIAVLNEYFASKRQKDPGPALNREPDAGDMARNIKDLGRMLKASDAASTRVFAKMAPQLRKLDSELFRRMDEAVKDFDFDLALEYLEGFQKQVRN